MLSNDLSFCRTSIVVLLRMDSSKKSAVRTLLRRFPKTMKGPWWIPQIKESYIIVSSVALVRMIGESKIIAV
jgi:hypothetical protein